MIYQHMRHTAAAVVPTGDFLAHVGDWTGLPPAELLGLMRGAAPVSAGGSAELERLVAAFARILERAELLESDGRPGRVLEALRSLDSEAGPAVCGYLDLVGYRLLDGFDISGPLRARAAGRAAAGDPHRRRRGEGRRDARTSRSRSPRSAPRCPRSTGPSSTSCSGRPG